MAEEQVIVLICNDKVGETMAGPGIRYFQLAKSLSNHFKTILCVPDSCDLPKQKKFEILKYDSRHSSKSLSEALVKIKPEFILAQSLRPPFLRMIKKMGIGFIADLYDPLVIETLEYTKQESTPSQNNTYNFNYDTLALQIHSADHILCASEVQRNFYFGILSSQKLITPKNYSALGNFSGKISLLPFGLEADEPELDNPDILEETFPFIKKTDKIVYWGGGIWNWFDPLTVIKAIEILSKKRDDIKLFFLGTRHPNPKIKEMSAVTESVQYCEKNDLLDKFVFFNLGWTPYNKRANYLLRSSVGISTHFDTLETRFSFRTRILDYIWAKLPIVTTTGDAFASMVSDKKLGAVVQFQDHKSLALAIENIVDNTATTKQMINNLEEARKHFVWDNLVLNLVDLISKQKITKTPLSFWMFFKLSFNFYFSGIKKKISK